MKQDTTLMVTVWRQRQEGNGDGDANGGGDRGWFNFRTGKGIKFNFTLSQIVD